MESWIEDAFKKAKEEVEHAAPIANRIESFLDDNTPRILDMWSEVVGKARSVRVAVVLSEHEQLSDDLADMMKCFCIAGYLLAKHDYENQ